MKKTGDQENVSKSAAKNKKRREAAKKKKEEGAQPVEGSAKVSGIEQKSNSNKASGMTGKHCDSGVELTGDPEKDKKLKKLNDKLVSIQQLKKQQKEGKQLEKNQIEKIGKENEIIMEMRKLQV